MTSSGSPLIVVADDDPDVLALMRLRLKERGYRVDCASDKRGLFECLSREKPLLLLLDLQFGDFDGIELMSELRRQRPNLCVALFTAHASVDTAVSAIKLGAFDYLTKPVDFHRLDRLIDHAVEKFVLEERLDRLQKLVIAQDATQRLLGDSPAMQRVRETISTIAPTDLTVLVLGESGTGKELVARAVHDKSGRSTGPFVPINMAALPRELAESALFGHEKGAFTGADTTRVGCCEAADKGTLFLDELGTLELPLQAKLLRFLQDRSVQRVGSNKTLQVDVRVVAATNADLEELVREGRFREDLYYRLNVVPIMLPPLRERPTDIPLLAAHFLRRAAARYQSDERQFSDEALASLMAYRWPGNVRQLENIVERVAVLCRRPIITIEDLPAEIAAGATLPIPAATSPITVDTVSAGASAMRVGTADVAAASHAASPSLGTETSSSDEAADEADGALTLVERLERDAIRQALRDANGSVTRAAKLLGLGQATVYRKIKRYGIRASDAT